VTAMPNPAPTIAPRRPKVITVASGKGGVGKTQLAVNLATALAESGKRVLLIDADLGLANANLLLGLSPQTHAGHLLDGSRPFEDVAVSYEGRFDLLPAGSALVHLAELELEQQVRLLERIELHQRDYDVVLLDAGAGIGGNVRLALALADETLVVMSPETTSLTDAYALVKIGGRAKDNARFRIVVNHVELAEQAREMFDCLDSACTHFLSIGLEFAGYVYRDAVVEKALRAQRPFVQSFPTSAASRCVQALARRLVEENRSS